MRRREALLRLSGLMVAAKAYGDVEETAGGWQKYSANPVIGGQYGTVFDVALLYETGHFLLWGSWRPKKSLALFKSGDGIHWSEPIIVLSPNAQTDWEENVNRPVVVKRDDTYHLWYTGQANGSSCIGYATSPDGRNFTRQSQKPVLAPEQLWEKTSVMCPHVIWDGQLGLYRMWYSGGEQYEPDAIGYATSPDGLHWTKHHPNPIFVPDPSIPWEHYKVTACQVVPYAGLFYMFYIGFRDIDHAQIGVALSPNGITAWERHKANPIIRAGVGKWDGDACYKPFAILHGKRWMLWYNGRHQTTEQIGLAIHEGESLGFA